MYFFVDESIHIEAGFILAACCFIDQNPNSIIEKFLIMAGFDPETEEYKSSSHYLGNDALVKLRDMVGSISTETTIGLVVVPTTHREYLGEECLKAVQTFVKLNNLEKIDVKIYLDQGMFLKEKSEGKITDTNITVFPEQNSILVRGLQIADYIAHCASLQLKWDMGLLPKIINGHNDLPTELGFEMWARLRYKFFQASLSNDVPIHQVEPYGLYISEYCDEHLTQQARNAFAEVYVGCIH